jgi:hypothetical protein
MDDSITVTGTSRGWGQLSHHAAWIDAGVTGDESGQMVDRFQQTVIDRHPQMVATLAGTDDVYPG